MHATPTFITETLHLVTYVQLFSITFKVNSWRTQHQSLQCASTVRPYLLMIQLQLPYKNCRTCLTNHMGPISHITPLIITSLRGGHTHTHTHTHRYTHTCTYTHMHIHTSLIRSITRNQAHGSLWLVCHWFNKTGTQLALITTRVILKIYFQKSLVTFEFLQMK